MGQARVRKSAKPRGLTPTKSAAAVDGEVELVVACELHEETRLLQQSLFAARRNVDEKKRARRSKRRSANVFEGLSEEYLRAGIEEEEN